jgi:hypothetical protein
MPWRHLLVLTLALMSLSACVVEPGGYGRGGGYGQWSGGYHNQGNDHGPRDYGRRTWRQDR